MATRRRQFASRGPRRQRVWARTTTQAEVPLLLATPTSIDLLEDFRTVPGASTIGATVGRVRMDISLRGAPPISATEGFTFGLVVDSVIAQPEDIDLGSLPHLNWMWYRTLYAPSGAENTDGENRTFEIDVKSMRKVAEVNETLWLAATQNGNAVGDFNASVSVLLLLP